MTLFRRAVEDSLKKVGIKQLPPDLSDIVSIMETISTSNYTKNQMTEDDKFTQERLKHDKSESLMFNHILKLEEQMRNASVCLNELHKRIDKLESLVPTDIEPSETAILYETEKYCITENGILHNPKEIPLANIVYELAKEIKKLKEGD